MPLSGRPIVPLAAVALCAVAVAVAAAAAQESRSAPIAKELAQTLDSSKMDGIAAADPSAPGAFVAALYIPGTQLLVVSAKYAAPSLLVERIAAGDFRGVYVDLQSASVQGTKVFIMDAGADGLTAHAEGDQPPDSWDEGNKTLDFDGDWKKAKIAETEYQKTFTAADDRYARMLSTLLAQAKQMKSKAGS